MSKLSGIDLIARERQRQIQEEGWTPGHDDEHTDGSLAMVAALYAAPVKLYRKHRLAAGYTFLDPWPSSWASWWDKRFYYGERRDNPGNMAPKPSSYTEEERIDLLVKAGALIAAELDRRIRMKSNQEEDNDDT